MKKIEISFSPDKAVRAGAVVAVALAFLGLLAHYTQGPDGDRLENVTFFRQHNDISIVHPADALTIAQQLESAGIILDIEQCASALSLVGPLNPGRVIENPCVLKPPTQSKSKENTQHIILTDTPDVSSNFPTLLGAGLCTSGLILAASAGFVLRRKRTPQIQVSRRATINNQPPSPEPKTKKIPSKKETARQRYLDAEVWTLPDTPVVVILGTHQHAPLLDYRRMRRGDIVDGERRECPPPVRVVKDKQISN